MAMITITIPTRIATPTPIQVASIDLGPGVVSVLFEGIIWGVGLKLGCGVSGEGVIEGIGIGIGWGSLGIGWGTIVGFGMIDGEGIGPGCG